MNHRFPELVQTENGVGRSAERPLRCRRRLNLVANARMPYDFSLDAFRAHKEDVRL